MMIVKAACRLKVQQFTMALEDARVPALFSHSRTTRGKKERKKKKGTITIWHCPGILFWASNLIFNACTCLCQSFQTC